MTVIRVPLSRSRTGNKIRSLGAIMLLVVGPRLDVSQTKLLNIFGKNLKLSLVASATALIPELTSFPPHFVPAEVLILNHLFSRNNCSGTTGTFLPE